MIIIKRKKHMLLKIDEVYYCSDFKNYKTNADIIMFIQSTKKAEKSKIFNTIHINLDKNIEEIFNNFNKATIRACKQGNNENINTFINFNPDDEAANKFCKFYNIFAKEKELRPINEDKLKTFIKSGNVAISKAQLGDKILCYHLYLYDNKRSRLLFSASHYMLEKESYMRNLIGRANRLLIWEDIKAFKRDNLSICDLGGIALNNEKLKNIDNFKRGFGGYLVSEYTFYYPNTMLGKLLLKITGKNCK